MGIVTTPPEAAAPGHCCRHQSFVNEIIVACGAAGLGLPSVGLVPRGSTSLAISLRHHHALTTVFTTAPYAVRQGIFGLGYLLAPRRLPGLLPLGAVPIRAL